MLYVNDEAAKRLGIAKEKVTQYRVRDFEPLFRQPYAWQAHVEELKRGSLTIQSENIHQITEQVFPVEVTVTYQLIGEKGYVIATSRDITERIKNQWELQRTKDQLSSIFNALSDVVWSISIPENKMEYVTPSVIELYEVPIEY